MISGKKLAVGIDVGWAYTQISYLKEGMQEPETLKKMFPSPREEKEQAVAEFLRDSLKEVPELICMEDLDGLDIVLPALVKEQADLWVKAAKSLGISEGSIQMEGPGEASVYFALSQQRELWYNDVVFFDFSAAGFIYRRFHIQKEMKQNFVEMEQQDFSDSFHIEDLDSQEGREQADKDFLELAGKLFQKRLISAVYLIGDGFYGEEWGPNSLKFICQRRRVFKGLNLYTKAAAFAAYDRVCQKAFDSFVFICPERVKASVGIRIVHKEEPRLLNLVKAGSNWYQARACIECIPDETAEMEFVITPYGTRKELVETISLKEFPYRGRRMTRLMVTLVFLNDKRCLIQVKDLGFGMFAAPSDILLRRELTVDAEKG